MRQRAISAAVLVPVLLIVLALGGTVLAIAIAIATGLAAIEVFRLPDGSNWEGRGLTPNIPVAGAWDEFGADDPDPVLKAAIEALAR